jgi:CubicO group peptidase (beta-lactamase class C family)
VFQKACLFLFLFGTFSPGINGQTNLEANINKVLLACEEVHGFSGVVKINWSDSIQLEAYQGLANRSFNIPVQRDTRFSINSISKTFTATLVLQLVEQGKLKLDQPIGSFLPLQAAWKDSITIHQLLSHSSGLPREAGLQWYDEKTFEEQLLLVDQLQLQFPPGSQYGYSNAGYILLGALAEAVTGESYRDLIQKYIIDVLSLKNTGVYQGKKPVENQAVPYRMSGNGIETAWRTKHLGENAGGGLYSNPADLYVFVSALQEEKLLSEPFQNQLFTSHVKSGKNEAEGYAWSIKNLGGQEYYMATGSGYGTKSVILFAPETGNFIGINSNWGNLPVLNLLRDLFLTLEGGNPTLPDTRSLASPRDYEENLGTYQFENGILSTQLGMVGNTIVLQAIEDRLFLQDEILVKKAENKLGLSYTDEVLIWFERDRMHIQINENHLQSKSFKPEE